MKRKPTALGRAVPFNEMLKETIKNYEKELKDFETAGDGLCMRCQTNPVDELSQLDPLACAQCNSETEDILKQLRGPGFVELKISRSSKGEV